MSIEEHAIQQKITDLQKKLENIRSRPKTTKKDAIINNLKNQLKASEEKNEFHQNQIMKLGIKIFETIGNVEAQATSEDIFGTLITILVRVKNPNSFAD